ncbi:MAG: hypothetical protein EXR76_09220 [Myxococcales bacterium]|nr:hypothetical protein [Myxococcales bacterium]
MARNLCCVKMRPVTTPLTPDLNIDGLPRLDWLIRLRWLALVGVTAAAALVQLGVVRGVNVPVMAAAVVVGIVANLLLVRWSRRRGVGETDVRHVFQALLDTGALTLVIWSAGGADCPFIGFYAFPVLLAALLGDRPALWPTGLATAAGLAFQVAASRIEVLRIGQWHPAPYVGGLLDLVAVGLTVAGVAYFAKVFSEAFWKQDRARRDADTLLRLSLEGLEVGLEVVQRGRIAWQNVEALGLLGPRVGQSWRCPGPTGSCGLQACGQAFDGQGRFRCEFPLRPGEGPQRTYELLGFSLEGGADEQFVALYLDRTNEVAARRQLVHTERLASLGRTAQGMAHELNTPLSTIRTLATDLHEALAPLQMTDEARADIDDSVSLITAEVERCRRLTHALLGRSDVTGRVTLAHVIDRAVALVFPQGRASAQVEIDADAGRVEVPLDPCVQILVNLLQNARDAAPGAPVTVRALRSEGGLEVTVSDRGPGLSNETLDHLFEPFYTTKPPGQGTGLGLFTSYALAQSLNGQVSLTNLPEGGARAVFSLPVLGVSIGAGLL